MAVVVRRLAMALVLLPVPGAWAADEAEDRAVQTVEDLGGKVTWDARAPGKPVVVVYLYSPLVKDAHLKDLAGLKRLRKLTLLATRVTDAGLKELAGLQQLRELALIGTKVTDAGLKELTPLKRLRELNLDYTALTDAG